MRERERERERGNDKSLQEEGNSAFMVEPHAYQMTGLQKAEFSYSSQTGPS